MHWPKKRSAILLLFLLSSCVPEVETGGTAICVDDTSIEEVLLSGTVISNEDWPHYCSHTSRRITLEQMDGRRRTFGITIQDANGNDVTPDLDISPGDSASILYRSDDIYSEGIVVTDAQGLILAIELGGVDTLQPDETPDLTVTRGTDIVAKTDDKCSPKEGFELIFSADESVTLTPFSSADISILGDSYSVLAVAAYSIGDPALYCFTERGIGPTNWAAFRNVDD